MQMYKNHTDFNQLFFIYVIISEKNIFKKVDLIKQYSNYM